LQQRCLVTLEVQQQQQQLLVLYGLSAHVTVLPYLCLVTHRMWKWYSYHMGQPPAAVVYDEPHMGPVQQLSIGNCSACPPTAVSLLRLLQPRLLPRCCKQMSRLDSIRI
jgi:hypothetical protein